MTPLRDRWAIRLYVGVCVYNAVLIGGVLAGVFRYPMVQVLFALITVPIALIRLVQLTRWNR